MMTLTTFQSKWCQSLFLKPSAFRWRWPVTGHLDFVLKDEINHPFYAWPRTLLNYPIDYDARIDPTRYRLTCLESDEIVPFQISQPRADRNEFRQHAVFRFISDLPGSGSHTYRLALGTPEMAKPPITVVKQDVCLLIDCGPMQVRIPASQNIKGEAPGPLIQVGRGGRWVGSSSLTIVGHPIVSIKTEEIEVGPLLVSYKIVYLTESGYRYVATVECTAGRTLSGFMRICRIYPQTGSESPL